MYWYINKHVEPDGLAESYDIELERFPNEKTAMAYLADHYLPLHPRPGVRESIDVRVSYDEDKVADFDPQKPTYYQIWEHEYYGDETKPLERFDHLAEAEKRIEAWYLPHAPHEEDRDMSYKVTKENK